MAIVTVWANWSPGATKSEPGASATVRFTVRSAGGAMSAVSVNSAAAPSATVDKTAAGAMVMVGSRTVSLVTVWAVKPAASLPA